MYAVGGNLFLILRLLLVLSTAALTQCTGYVGAPIQGEYYWGGYGDDWGDFDDYDEGDDFDDDFGGDEDEGDEDDFGGDEDEGDRD